MIKLFQHGNLFIYDNLIKSHLLWPRETPYFTNEDTESQIQKPGPGSRPVILDMYLQYISALVWGRF